MDNHNEHGEHTAHGMACKCPHHKVIPILVIILGLEFLFAELNVLTWAFVNVTWPILIIIAGVVKLNSSNCNCIPK